MKEDAREAFPIIKMYMKIQQSIRTNCSSFSDGIKTLNVVTDLKKLMIRKENN
jgi:hypothetical protein